MTVASGFTRRRRTTNSKTPSLLFIGGTRLISTIGKTATLEDLISRTTTIGMGKTNQLSAEDRRRLSLS